MNITSLASRLWEANLARNPISASLMGFHQYDHLLPDLTPDALDEVAADLRQIGREASAIEDQDLSAQDRITRDLILHEIETEADAIEGRYLLGAIDTFVGPASSLLVSVNNLSATDQQMAKDYAQRWSQLGTFLENVLLLNQAELAKGRTPARIVAERVVHGFAGYLDSPVDDDPFLQSMMHPGADDNWKNEARSVVERKVRPAYASYRDSVIQEVLPAARDNDHPGLRHIDDGAEVYTKLVRLYTTSEADPRELHEYGVWEATDKLVEEWQDVGQSTLGISDKTELFHRLRSDPELSYQTADEMVEHARSTVERAWSAVDGWFGARPETSCGVRPVPEAIAADLPPAYYFAPSEDGSRPGTYFINTHEPQSRKRFNYESIHFHEAIPGHHFDRSLSVELKELPEFRRHFGAFAHAEGWGLYSERLADEMGLYSSDMDRLGMLANDAWRAGRLVVDTGLHYLGWTRQQAIDWFMEWTPVPEPVVHQEIDRYIGMAGQALAYKTGQREILRLRREAEGRLGDRFSIADFHDAVLTSGGLTLPVLTTVVGEWIDSRTPTT